MVVWDLGGVLAPPGRALTALADALDMPESDFAPAYWAHRDAYDLGGAPEEYWHGVAAGLGRSLDAEWVERLDRIDTECWAVLAPEADRLLARLAARGTPLGVLSNAPTTLATAVRRASWSLRFDKLVFSADVGLAKPDARIYETADARLGRAAAASGIVFFDDRPENVEAARAHGWRAHVWTGGEAAVAALRQEGVLDD